MKGLSYIIAALFFVFWAIGFFVLQIGASVHLFLVIAAYLLFIQITKSGKRKHVAFKPMQLSLRN